MGEEWGHPQLTDCLKAEKTPCLHFSLLFTIGKYFTMIFVLDNKHKKRIVVLIYEDKYRGRLFDHKG